MKLSMFNVRSDLNKNRLWCWIGQALYFLCWPLIRLVISMTPKRARVVVIYDGKILLTKDWLGSGKWSIPGGGLHRGEDQYIGAAREFEEETGVMLDTTSLKLLGEFTAKGWLTKTQLVVFRVNVPKKPEIMQTGLEILDYIWADANQIQALSLDYSTKQVLATFESDINLVH